MMTNNISSRLFLLLALCASFFSITPAWSQAAGNQQVDLSAQFNIAGIYASGVTFPGTGGMDGGGDGCSITPCADAYMAQQLLGANFNATAPTLTLGGVLFNFGPVNTTPGTLVNDEINLSPGVTVSLPAAQQAVYSTMIMLGTAVQGHHTGMVTVNYTTGSPDVFNQTFSDWCGFGGNQYESIAVGPINRINSDGTPSGASCNMYAYTYPLDFTRVVDSIGLSNTDGSNYTLVLAVTLKPPTYTIEGAVANPASVAAGSNSTATVTVTPQPGYIGTIDLTCTVAPTILPSSAATPPTCSLNPTSVTVTADETSPPTTMLTFTTAKPASAQLERHGTLFYAFWLPVPGLALIGLGVGSRDARRKRVLTSFLLLMILALLVVAPACVSRVHLGNVGTPPGPYTVSITGVDTNGLTQASNPAGTSNTVTVTVTQ